MKKLKVLSIAVLLATTLQAQDSIKPAPALWRTLTVSHTFGVNASSNAFNQTALNLFYEYRPGIALTNWTGAQYPSQILPGWFSSQTLMTKRFDGLLLGSGLQYNRSLQMNTIPQAGSWFFVVNASYRFKLN
jgi:hypothetical protein